MNPRKLPEIEVRQHWRLRNRLSLARPAAGPSQNWKCHARRKVHAAFGNDPEPGRARPSTLSHRDLMGIAEFIIGPAEGRTRWPHPSDGSRFRRLPTSRKNAAPRRRILLFGLSRVA